MERNKFTITHHKSKSPLLDGYDMVLTPESQAISLDFISGRSSILGESYYSIRYGNKGPDRVGDRGWGVSSLADSVALSGLIIRNDDLITTIPAPILESQDREGIYLPVSAEELLKFRDRYKEMMQHPKERPRTGVFVRA